MDDEVNDEVSDEEIHDLFDEDAVDDIDFQSDSGSEIENNETQGPELSEEEKKELAEMFSFFDGFTRDAISFIQERFGSFDEEPLNLFEQCFDVDMMVACCLSNSDVKKYGKEAFNKLTDHFSLLFSEQELTDMKHEYARLKFHIQKVKRLQSWMKPVNIFAGVIANRAALALENVALMVQIMFVISPSTAHVERSFSSMNQIKTKLRSSMGVDMLNKHMWVCQTDLHIIPEKVMDFWVQASTDNGNALVMGKVRVPSIFSL
jgi:hypothetical protein